MHVCIIIRLPIKPYITYTGIPFELKRSRNKEKHEQFEYMNQDKKNIMNFFKPAMHFILIDPIGLQYVGIRSYERPEIYNICNVL